LYTNLLAVNFNVSDVILEDRRNVNFRKLIFAEDNEQACFTTRAIADNYQLLPQCRHRRLQLHTATGHCFTDINCLPKLCKYELIELRKQFFVNGVVKRWNMLPDG